MRENEIITYMEKNMESFCETLKTFVELESPSYENKTASDQCSRFLENLFKELGCSIEILERPACGNHIYGELGEGEKSVIIIGHYDTVFPMGTIEKMPYKIVDGKIYGPGVLDMKGGIIMAYFAIKALKDLELLPNKKIGFFFNGDEEAGSFYSSDAIVEKAKAYKCALIAEPGINCLEAVKTSRYGRGTYEIKAKGVAAHSGSNSHLAVSPILELAKQLVRIEEVNEKEEDVTLAPTAIAGGIFEACMIPEEAKFAMDVRFKTTELSKSMHQKLLNLKSFDKRITLEVKGKIDKPVMIGDEGIFEKYKAVAKKYGIHAKGVGIGGGSDGNFTAAAGIPTLDGIGTTGEFLHNPKEYIHKDHVPIRTAILAEFIKTL